MNPKATTNTAESQTLNPLFSQTGVNLVLQLLRAGSSDEGVALRAARITTAMRAADDVDLWGLLADTFTAAPHSAGPQWNADMCEALIRACVELRSGCDGQSEALAAWQVRWQQLHRIELGRALCSAQIGTWADACRFAQVWSYGRFPVPPFIGTAELVLQAGGPEISSNKLIQPQSAIPSCLGTRTPEAVPPSGRHVDPRQPVVVVAPQDDELSFKQYGASRQLLWALDKSGLPWRLWEPWTSLDTIDLDAVPGVIFWSYGPLANDYLHHATTFERMCQARKVPILNSVLAGWDTRHSAALRKWQTAGIPCPAHEKFTSVADIGLQYPMILRTDGVHVGRGMYKVENRHEAEEVMARARAAYVAGDESTLAPPNLAIEFVDVRGEDGLYSKQRAYVVGGSMISRHHVVGDHWLVNQESAAATAGADHLSRTNEEEDPELIIRAGRATGSDVAALDYSKRADGSYVFWESNRYFSMVGDSGYSRLFRPPQQPKKLGRRDRRLGKALLALLQNRFECAGSTSS